MQITPTVTPPPGLTPSTVDVRPLTPTHAGTLSLEKADATGRTFMSAASGLAAAPGSSAAWAVSDEYGELVRFAPLSAPGIAHAGVPVQKKKPDLETITHVPAGIAGAVEGAGAMLAIGSGSAEKGRDRGALQTIDASGAALGAAQIVDFGPLFTTLRAASPMGLNVEGAVVRSTAAGAELLLFHRGRITGDTNRIYVLDAAAALSAARAGTPVPASTLRSEHTVGLGKLNGNALGFADAQLLDDGRILFAASAESEGANGDGEILGSAVGTLSADFALQSLRPLTGVPRKVEGIELTRRIDPAAPATALTLVTDPDAPQSPTEVLHVDLATPAGAAVAR